MQKDVLSSTQGLSFEDFKKIVLNDYRVINESRQTSLLGRKEVLTGKAKFGIFGDGKELAQVALAKVFKDGDFRSGYYRDQTFMMSIGQLSLYKNILLVYTAIPI
jgi:2-oxoisovalerate dehydrogenase E1 component